MEIRKVTMQILTDAMFQQIVDMEQNCGLEPYSPEMLLDCIRYLDTFVCFDGDAVAGFITIQPKSSYLGGSIYIVNLNVAKSCRRQGIGESLILFSCRQYPDMALMTLDVSRTNTAALGLYRKLTFRKAEIPSRNGHTDIVMYAKTREILALDTLRKIRHAEEESHIQAYTQHSLFAPGSWLAKPVKTVLEIIEMLKARDGLRMLDLGCGVGRNSIPAAKKLGAQADCVDILPLAIEKLQENAEIYGVSSQIKGIVSGIDAFAIPENTYDLILAISALEHMDSENSFSDKLHEIRRGLRPDGIACLIINSGVTEVDKKTGQPLHPQFEVNLPTEVMHQVLKTAFSGLNVLKETIVRQEYDIPRGEYTSHLTSQVITYVIQK